MISQAIRSQIDPQIFRCGCFGGDGRGSIPHTLPEGSMGGMGLKKRFLLRSNASPETKANRAGHLGYPVFLLPGGSPRAEFILESPFP